MVQLNEFLNSDVAENEANLAPEQVDFINYLRALQEGRTPVADKSDGDIAEEIPHPTAPTPHQPAPQPVYVQAPPRHQQYNSQADKHWALFCIGCAIATFIMGIAANAWYGTQPICTSQITSHE